MVQSQDTYKRLDDGASSQETTLSETSEAQHLTPVQAFVTYRRGKHKLILFGLGIAECVLGVLMIVSAIIPLCMTIFPFTHRYFGSRLDMTYSSQGLWGGVVVVVTGILGVLTKKNHSVCLYKANMAMGIVTASLSCAVVILSSIASALNFAPILHIIVMISSFVAMVICIVHSAFCCARVCCRSKQHQGFMAHVPQQNKQMVRLANGQYAIPVENAAMPQQYGYVMAASAQASTAVDFQPPQTGVFAQQTVLPPQGAAVQPSTLNSPSTQDNAYPRYTENEADKSPPSYSALSKK